MPCLAADASRDTDDTHEPLLHTRHLYAFNRLEEFIGRFIKGTPPRSTGGGR